MYIMKLLFALALATCVNLAQAQHVWAPPTVVAQTGHPHPERVTLLVDACDARSALMRAQWVTRDHTVIWGCWGYNPTGVQVQWSTGRTEHIEWVYLHYWGDGFLQQLGYQRVHQRVWLLRNIK